MAKFKLEEDRKVTVSLVAYVDMPAQVVIHTCPVPELLNDIAEEFAFDRKRLSASTIELHRHQSAIKKGAKQCQ